MARSVAMRARAALTGGLALALWAAASASAFAAGTYYVEGVNPSCSNTGPGTIAIPYCTISAAASARGGPNTTLLVKPGTYREQVTVPLSGIAGQPFVIQALGANVIVDGTDDFSNPAKWTLLTGSVYLAATVTSSPVQVFSDGARLSAYGVPADQLTPGTFRYIAGEGLYVNIGDGNPGTHQTFVGKRSNGFRITGRAFVTVDGFTVTRTDDHGIYLLSSANNDIISHNTVTWTGNTGISVSGCTFITVDSNVVNNNNNHGISLLSSTADSVVKNNEAYQNARSTGVAANGIRVDGTSRITIQRNRSHNNQDSGFQFNHSDHCSSLQNSSWYNGDHGYDHLDSHQITHIGDVAYGNYRDGVSIEGSNTDIVLNDCLSISNGSVTNRFNLWIDASSTTGFVSDYNIFWNSFLQDPIKYNVTTYATVAAFYTATGQDQHSLQSDPYFVSASLGDFHINYPSPAIDSASTTNALFPATDADGHPRFDDPGIANTGVGPITYADRGAFESSRPCFPETCNGVDEDCDGTNDNGFDVGAACTAGVGACANSGIKVCSGDHAGTVCNVGPGAPGTELCGDGIDNDCDGSTDEGFDTGAACTVGVGACQASGTKVCSGDHHSSVCSATAGTPGTELCGDGIDNDCDGSTDEGFDVGAACTVGVGACQASGTKVCSGNNLSTVCSATAGTPGTELCGDGLDNDCDGSTDEGFGLGTTCTAGVGACQGTGTFVCSGDGLSSSCNAVAGSPVPEACDNLDNDCDGSIDNGNPGSGAVCGTSNVAPCSLGVTDCQGGSLVCVGAVEPVAETCDGIDNDCDGSVDNNAQPKSAALSLAPVAGGTRISWVLADSPVYDLVRGDLGILLGSGGNFTLATTVCLASESAASSFDDPDQPAAESGYWYVLRGENGCGAGSYDSGAASQIGSRDGEIAASAAACP